MSYGTALTFDVIWFLVISMWEQELAAEWARAHVVRQNLVRDPSGAEMEIVDAGTPGSPIFAVLHRPANPARGLVVVCSPPYAEAIRNHRRELLFAWLATQSDLAVVRFHPRGAGHSSGDAHEITLGTIQRDVESVTRFASEALESPLIGFVGARLGGVVAHRSAALCPGTAVAWWQPVLDATAFMRELFRARMIGDLKQGSNINARQLNAQLDREGMVDILGSPISLAFRNSLFERPLDEAPPGPRNGLFVQMSRQPTLQKSFGDFVASLRERAWNVDTLVIPDEETWWFGARGGPVEHEIRRIAMRVVPETVDFFDKIEGH